jgi:hypothetical protein
MNFHRLRCGPPKFPSLESVACESDFLRSFPLRRAHQASQLHSGKPEPRTQRHRKRHDRLDSGTSRGAVITIEEALGERSVGRADLVAVGFVKRLHTILQMKQDSTAALNTWRRAKDCRSHL